MLLMDMMVFIEHLDWGCEVKWLIKFLSKFRKVRENTIADLSHELCGTDYRILR
jgi:hypothetical protein